MSYYARIAHRIYSLINYRKKYNKMRHTFKGKMQDSNSLFNDEQKALKIARRLQEQNE